MNKLKIGYGIFLSVSDNSKITLGKELSKERFNLIPLPEEDTHVTILSGRSMKDMDKILSKTNFKSKLDVNFKINLEDTVYLIERDDRLSSVLFIENQIDFKVFRKSLLNEIKQHLVDNGYDDIDFNLTEYDKNRDYHISLANKTGNKFLSVGDVMVSDKKNGVMVNEYFDGIEPIVTFDNPDNDLSKINRVHPHMYAPAIGQGNRHFLNEDNESDAKAKIINVMNKLPFNNFVKSNGGELYAVGGVVRDAIMGKSSDDLDIVVTKVELDDLISILKQYGSASFNGTNFGVVNFKPNDEKLLKLIQDSGFDTTIDIALPRKDMAGEGNKYQDIKAMVDPNMSIEADLERRDFTINSMAINSDGKVIDPFNGLEAIKNNEIAWTNPKAFLDDPLRMLRAIRFASVYNYRIAKETKHAIKTNRKNIKNVPYERFNLEFQKMIKKGGGKILKNAIKLMDETGLFDTVFGFKFNGNLNNFDKVVSLAELGWYLFKDQSSNPEALYMDKLRGDINGNKQIKAFKLTNLINNDKVNNKWVLFNMYNLSPTALSSHIVQDPLSELINEMKNNHQPFTYKELAVNGNDLMHFGFKNVKIKEKMDELITLIFSNKLKNDKSEIINLLDTENVNPDSLNEIIKAMKRMM